MEALNTRLKSVLEGASFDIEYDRYAGSERPPVRGISAARVGELCGRPEEQVGGRRVRVDAPEGAMSRFVDVLRRMLGRFIDPEGDRIGHAFPIDANNYGRSTLRNDGIMDCEFVTTLRYFAKALVQAAAIAGVEGTVRSVAAWERGAPIGIDLSTVLNNLPLDAPVSLGEGIRLTPLALTTSRLPRVPISGHTPAEDYLGLTLLTRRLRASPVFFRPEGEGRTPTVRAHAVDDVDFDLVCEALSLHANRHVSLSAIWNDYPEAAAFRSANPSSWSRSGDRLEPVDREHLSIDFSTDAVTVTPRDDAAQSLSPDEVLRLLAALRHADRKLRTAVHRWRRSIVRGASREDACIDLRIALEALYLKDFSGEHSQEMRFRLALFGAWHLADGPDERRSIRKTLRDAYDDASKAVHLGELPDGGRNLSGAQDLCRRGIVKQLLEGPPRDWGDLILGA